MKPLYIIVHEDCVHENYGIYPRQDSVIAEIERIKIEEEYIPSGNINNVPSNLDPKRSILVCGAYYSGVLEGNSNEPQCIDTQLKALLDKKYDAQVHEPGTLLSVLNAKHPLRALLEKPKNLVG